VIGTKVLPPTARQLVAVGQATADKGPDDVSSCAVPAIPLLIGTTTAN
jgi:hypothetical protein